jgi:hypothetical protein
MYTSQSESPYPIIIREIFEPPVPEEFISDSETSNGELDLPEGIPVQNSMTLRNRRAVITDDSSKASIIFDFYPVYISTKVSKKYQIPFKSHTLLDSNQINFNNFFEYLGTDTTLLPDDITQMDIKSKFSVLSGNDSSSHSYNNIFQNNFRINLHLIDLNDPSLSFSSNLTHNPTASFNLQNSAGHKIVIRPEIELIGLSKADFKVGVGEIYSPETNVPTENILSEVNSTKIINRFSLKPPYPNPFNPRTTFEFTLPRAEEVLLTIYNILGEEVSILVSGRLNAGIHQYTWDATGYPNGVYIYRLKAGNYDGARKIILLK